MANRFYEGKIVNTLSNSRKGCFIEVEADMMVVVREKVWLSYEEPKEVLYAIHMQGPDDVIAAPSKAAAEAVVKNFNQYWEDHKAGRGHDVHIVAAVVEWTHGPVEHAKDVLASFGEYADLLTAFEGQSHG